MRPEGGFGGDTLDHTSKMRWAINRHDEIENDTFILSWGFTALKIHIAVFWVMTPYSLVDVYQLL
jgi:hypothetical protein